MHRILQRTTLAVTIAAALSVAPVASADIVVPGAADGTEAGGNNGFPFNIGDFGLSFQHYQQVYGAGEFGASPLTISGLRFRPDADTGGAFATTITGVTIRLSTTSAAVDGLSTTFADNLGADATTVFSGSLPLSSANTGPGGGPKDFDIQILFATGFNFNPTLGNLLLDVVVSSEAMTTQFDAADTSGDAVSRLFTADNNPSATTGTVDSLGLVTQFVTGTAAVPEPASLALLGLGLAGLGFARRRTRQPA